MKNKYNFSQIAQVYCQEIGVEVPFMEEYLIAVFKNQPIEEYDRQMKEQVKTNSEYFPEFWEVIPPQAELPEGFYINRKKKKSSKTINLLCDMNIC